ncbi:MAG: AAA family ATPase [Desulfobacterales bacterium]|nr:AAA family ATPase [Desulfobacterales bacterium]
MSVRLSVINFKGGVGKTTLAFHLGTYLAQENRVLLVDVDHQSSLSIVIMGGPLWESYASTGRTSNRIFESFCNRRIAMPRNEIIINNPFHEKDQRYDFYPNLDLVPAQFELDDTEIELASTTIGGPTVSEWEKRTLLASWIDQVNAEDEYDYIIFDCPPATKLVSQNALAASNYFLIPVIPDEMSSRGVTHFRNLVRNKIDAKLDFLKQSAGISVQDIPRAYVPTTDLAGIAPFMAKPAGRARSGLTDLHTRQLNILRNQWGNDIIEPPIKHMSGVAEAMDTGWPVWKTYAKNATPNVMQTMKRVCQEIKSRIV